MLTRRHFLAGLPLGLAFLAPRAFAAGSCAPIEAQGAQECTVGLVIGPTPLVRQRCENWCWAASIQAVFDLHGRGVAQEWAVEKIFGNDACEPASAEQIIQAINGEWLDQYGFKFRARAEQLPDAALSVVMTGPRPSGSDPAVDGALKLFSNDGAAAIVAELERGNPLIVGALGHATVLTAAKYVRDPSGFIELTELVIRDPWPDNPNRRTLSAAEVSNVFFVARVWVES